MFVMMCVNECAYENFLDVNFLFSFRTKKNKIEEEKMKEDLVLMRAETTGITNKVEKKKKK